MGYGPLLTSNYLDVLVLGFLLSPFINSIGWLIKHH